MISPRINSSVLILMHELLVFNHSYKLNQILCFLTISFCTGSCCTHSASHSTHKITLRRFLGWIHTVYRQKPNSSTVAAHLPTTQKWAASPQTDLSHPLGANIWSWCWQDNTQTLHNFMSNRIITRNGRQVEPSRPGMALIRAVETLWTTLIKSAAQLSPKHQNAPQLGK